MWSANITTLDRTCTSFIIRLYPLQMQTISTCTQFQCYHVKWVIQTHCSSLPLCRFATPMFWSWSFYSTPDAAEIPHVPHRGAARGAHQWHGGDQHALTDHQTLRPLSVSHQWHLIAQCVVIESMCIIVPVCVCSIFLTHFSTYVCI